MATRKASVKRKAARDLQRATTPVEAREIIEEIASEIEPKAEVFPIGKKVPGIVIGGNKVTYNYKDLEEMFPIVTFTPDETTGITYQGVRVQAISGIEMHVPKCFKDVYDKHRQAVRDSNKLSDIGIKFDVIDLGAGPLPPEK